MQFDLPILPIIEIALGFVVVVGTPIIGFMITVYRIKQELS